MFILLKLVVWLLVLGLISMRLLVSLVLVVFLRWCGGMVLLVRWGSVLIFLIGVFVKVVFCKLICWVCFWLLV